MGDRAIEVYNYPLSPCGEKVRFALAEKALPFVDMNVDLGSKANLRPEFLRLNPKGLVPVLVYDAAIVADSTIILEFIEDTWTQRPLRPSSSLERARMRRWTKYVDEVLHPAWPGIAWPILVRPRWLAKPSDEVEAMLDALLDPRRRERQKRLYNEGLAAADCQQSIAVIQATCAEMEDELARSPWLAGTEYSLADVALLPYFVALEIFCLTDILRLYPRMRDWYMRACARPCFNGHPRTMISDDRLAEVSICALKALKEA